jgi:hypothetical protein
MQQFTQNAGIHLPDNTAGNFTLHNHFTNKHIPVPAPQQRNIDIYL